MSRILLLEDDISLIDGLKYTLEREGYGVDVAKSIREAKRFLKGGVASGSSCGSPYDLLLLDVSLPDGSGFALCRELREAQSEVPILFLTAADEEMDIIRGLDSGGDDYLTKPFRLGELCSRIRALLRRSGRKQEDTEAIKSGGLLIRPQESRAWLDGQPLSLTAMEFRLLCLLVKNQGRILTRERILDRLWDESGNGGFVDDNTLSVHVRRLREKIEEDPSSPKRLLTVRGFGYQWKEADI